MLREPIQVMFGKTYLTVFPVDSYPPQQVKDHENVKV